MFLESDVLWSYCTMKWMFYVVIVPWSVEVFVPEIMCHGVFVQWGSCVMQWYCFGVDV